MLSIQWFDSENIRSGYGNNLIAAHGPDLE